MKLGIVGLPNVGKSTLFNAITKAKVEASNYPFCTIEPNIGTVAVPDHRLEILAKIYDSDRIVPAFVDFVDIAGLVKGASKGEGLGNKFLSHIREVDAIIHLVRCFENKDIIHVDGGIDPLRDIETINTELILADIETLQKRIEKSQKLLKVSQDKKVKEQFDFYNNLMEHLSSGKLAKSFIKCDKDKDFIKDLFLLTAKPVLFVANISEDDILNPEDNKYFKILKEYTEKENTMLIEISAKIEEEIGELDNDQKSFFLDSLGLKESGLDRLIKASYKLLGLFSFLTAGKQEVRAWTISYGTKAPEAAGKIHSDFEKGFIRAEIVNYNDLIKYGSFNAAKENGKVRIEGKDYVMQEDDVVIFRFNV